MKKKFAIGAQHREHIAVTPAHVLPREEADAGDRIDDAEDQVDPAPRRHVEVERVVPRDDEEVVVEDGDEPGDDLEGADQ